MCSRPAIAPTRWAPTRRCVRSCASPRESRDGCWRAWPTRGLRRLDRRAWYPGHPRGRQCVLPHNGHSVRLTIGGVPRTFTVGADETYDYQLEAVVAALAGGPALPTRPLTLSRT